MKAWIFELNRNSIIYRPKGSLAWRWMLVYRDRHWTYRPRWGYAFTRMGSQGFMLVLGAGWSGLSFHWQPWMPREDGP